MLKERIMKPCNAIKICGLLGCLIFSANAFALFETIDPAAAVVQVRTSCVESGVPLNNCFTAVNPSPSNKNALTAWMTTVRKPNSANPLQVNIGAGTFGNLTLSCDAAGGFTGYTSFKGAGRSVSIIAGVNGVILIQNCDKLDFSDLGVSGTSYAYIEWDGGGRSTWQNVDVNTAAYSWREEYCGTTPGQHYWFGSRINAAMSAATAKTYVTQCDESFFFNSDIGVTFNENTSSQAMVFDVSGNAIVHVYGSVIRANAGSAGVSSANPGLFAAQVTSPTASMHIHGTGIDVLSTNATNIAALIASNGGMIHANEAAYNLRTGTGATVTRIINTGGHIHAPYLWEHIPDPTTIPNFTSVTGADMTTLANGTSDGHPHFAIYDSSCSSKWFDTVDKACKP